LVNKPNTYSQFQQIFESLYQPLPRLTASKACHLRQTLLDKFQAFQASHKDILPDNLHHRLNIISSIDPRSWKDNPDYYIVELVTSLAILSTLGNITIWLVRYLFANPDVLAKIKSEVQILLNSSKHGDKPTAMINLSAIRHSSPHLLSSWYETLRLHMTGVPREAVRDFRLHSGKTIQKGDIIFLLMAESNRDPQLWEDPERFIPDRFIGRDGKVVTALTRKVKTFGVAGNLCPGRHHAFGVVMAVVVSLLVTVDVSVCGEGGGWPEPVVGSSVSGGGFDRCDGDEVRVKVGKRERWRERRLLFEFEGGL